VTEYYFLRSAVDCPVLCRTVGYCTVRTLGYYSSHVNSFLGLWLFSENFEFCFSVISAARYKENLDVFLKFGMCYIYPTVMFKLTHCTAGLLRQPSLLDIYPLRF